MLKHTDLSLRDNRLFYWFIAGDSFFQTKPAIIRPFKRFNKSWASKIEVAFFICMIYDVPIAIGRVNQRTMSLVPPFFIIIGCVNYRIVWRILPRSIDRFRTVIIT